MILIVSSIQNSNYSENEYTLVINENFKNLRVSHVKKLKCKIPQLQLEGHENHEKRKSCKETFDWGVLKEQKWYLSEATKEQYSNVNCKYKTFKRVNDFKLEESNYIVLNENDLIKDEFFEVLCEGKSKINKKYYKYENIYAQIIRKESQKQINQDFNGAKNCKPLNVIMISYDSVSRISWLKRMQKTTDYMLNTMRFDILSGLNIIGDGTPAALIPILTGFTEEELPSALKNDPKGKYVDEVYPFIFADLHKLDYKTFWNEDWPQVGTFTYRMRGMKNDLTTHYMRAYQMKVWEKVKRAYERKGDLCLGAKTRHKRNIELLNEFIQTYKNTSSNYFAFMHYSENSHDGNSRLHLSDQDLFEFLKDNFEKNYFENSIIFIYSDHGDRFHTERQSRQGYLEERLPFMSIFLPLEIKRKYPEKFKALVENKDRLISPFDIHETLRDITCLISNQKQTFRENTRASTLFEQISTNRSCKDIGISNHFCTCNEWRELDVQTKLSLISANFIIDYINRLMKNFDICESLKINKIISIELLEYFYESQLKLQILTEPNNGLYEATIQIDSFNPLILKMTSSASISRLNKYGNQAWCVENIKSKIDLRKFCYCKNKFKFE